MTSGGPRPGAGRRRKDPALKLLTGTARADRDNELSEAVPQGRMIPPLHLSDPARLFFDSIALMLAEQKRASPHFAEHVALLAQRLEQIQRWQAVLEIEGDTYETSTATGGTMYRVRPEVRMLSDAMRHAQSLLGELMLTPAAALRLASDKPPADADPFEGF